MVTLDSKMQNLGLILQVFAFVLFFIAAVFNSVAPHSPRLVAAGLCFWVASEIFGGASRLFAH